ncbi:VgrG protein [Paraburkholderia caribensis]|uniref:type VI secretion system Vgr family protein n=1 Tax=Paraburkholderia caribensis TaxID=75105 RepID=UPI001CB5F1F8|nr:type VI secretion system Vgr family protein [Paraburkholderia caribensis]CAG9202174.1 VgrG protein [Paraburkholderia caribensis]
MGAQDVIAAITGRLAQGDRLLKLDTPIGSDVLVPQRVVGKSRIGRQFEFTVDAISTFSSIELKKLIAQPVTLWIQQSDQTYAPHNGYVHTARRLGSDGALTTYQISFASWMHFLKFRRDQRIWQDVSADQIISDVFNAHPQAQGWFRFALSKPLPARSYCRQNEFDWNFVHRLLETEGLYGFWQQADDGKSHTLVITDSLSTLDAMSPQAVSFYRAGTNSETDALTQWSSTRTLQSTLLTTRTFDYKSPSSPYNAKGTSTPTLPTHGALPAQAEVYEYTGAYTYGQQDRGDTLSRIRMEEWESRAKRFHGVGGVRHIGAGKRFTLSGHPDHDRDAADQLEFAVIESVWTIENNLPVAGDAPVFPHSLQRTVSAVRASHESERSFELASADGSNGFYRVDIEAQRTSVPYRSPFEHLKPDVQMESAIVVGPQNEEIYTDDLNRIRVRFIWDRLNSGDERASCWVRVAQSDAGSGYGGVHLPRVGEEVLIDYIDGDCDRPIAVGRVYNSANAPHWHSNGLLSGYRSKEFAGSGYNQMVMDDATGQNRVQLYSSSANSYLHLGYLIAHNGNARGAYLGSGFDLGTDSYGAVRAAKGLYVTTYAKQADSQQMEVNEPRQQLANAQGVIDAMSSASQTHQAENLKDGYDALKSFTDATQKRVTGASSNGATAGGGTGSANAFAESAMLFASPAGIGLSTQQSVHVSADRQINLVSGQSTHIATGGSLVASIAQKISLFAQNAGVKLFAGKGKVQVQAHSDNVELTAQKSVKLLSATQNIEAAAQQEILLTSGGAYIRIKDGNIQIHAPGTIDIKGSTHQFSGPTQQSYPLQSMLLPADMQRYSNKVDMSGLDAIAQQDGVSHAWGNTPYYVTNAAGTVLTSGVTDSVGQGSRFFTRESEDVHVWMEKDEWLSSEEIEAESGAPDTAPAPAAPDCSYLDGFKGRIDAPQDFYTKKNAVTLDSGKETKFKFPGGGQQDATQYHAMVNDHPLDIFVPKSGAPTGAALPDQQSIAKALETVPSQQLEQLSRVSINPAPNPQDAVWQKIYNKPDFYSAATASVSQGVAFYPWKDWKTIPQQYVDSTMTHETGHLWSETLWKDAASRQSYLDAIAKDGKPPSAYGANNPTEDFAESANMYWSSKGTPCEQEGRKRYPARYDYFDKIAK